jgi:lysophospholipase L1-like esterase
MRRVLGSSASALAAVVTPLAVFVGFAGLVLAPLPAGAEGRGGAPDDTTDAFDRVVTLGDSYSAGTGIHRDASDYDDQGPPTHSFDTNTRLGSSMCMRELDTTPGARLAEALGATSIVIACAGARIGDVPRQLEAASVPGDGHGTLVTMTIGGNDVRTRDGGGWTAVLLDCVLSMGCHRDDGNELTGLDRVGADLESLLSAMTQTHPELTIRVLGYPRLMQPDRWGCVGVTGIGTKEARWLDEQVDRVNEVLQHAVERAASASRGTAVDLAFVAVDESFDNHGACRIWQRDRYVNDAIWGETSSRVVDDDGAIVERHHDGPFTLSAASFHPSQDGYDAYFEALRESTTSSS